MLTGLPQTCVEYALTIYSLIYLYIQLCTHECIYILQFIHNIHNCQCNYD